jgi:predicted kinase
MCRGRSSRISDGREWVIFPLSRRRAVMARLLQSGRSHVVIMWLGAPKKTRTLAFRSRAARGHDHADILRREKLCRRDDPRVHLGEAIQSNSVYWSW